MNEFQNLVAWQLAMDLAAKCGRIAETFPSSERFVLKEQWCDAALSVPSNIAEGKGRWNIREYRQFVRYARGSLYELESHIIYAHRRSYITDETRDELIADAENVCANVNSLIRYLNRRAKRPPLPVTGHPLPPATAASPAPQASTSAAPTSPASASTPL